jgi:hypothetical protein
VGRRRRVFASVRWVLSIGNVDMSSVRGLGRRGSPSRVPLSWGDMETRDAG